MEILNILISCLFNLWIAVVGCVLVISTSFLLGFFEQSEILRSISWSKFRRAKLYTSTFSCSSHHGCIHGKLYKHDCRLDKRISGSSIIDDALQEILHYVLRDYVENWCNLITYNTEFLSEVRHTLHLMTVQISKRCKEVDWITFLTTRTVDSVAAHIRLHRKAHDLKTREKVSNEGDFTAAQHVEQAFFELELFDCNKKKCRKKMCVDSKYEKECLKMLGDFLLHLIGPKEEFDCRPVRLLASQILSSVLVIPLLNLISDPDYINQLIVWMCRDFTVTSEAFLTALRCTKNLGELESSREMLDREIALLRSHDLGGDDDIIVKQRLSSLLYVKAIVDHQLHKLEKENDCHSPKALPSEWNQLLASKATRVYQLPLSVILENNIALSYMLDFMSAIGCQSYLFFLINAEGWKIAVEQQTSSVKLAGFRVESDEYQNAKGSHAGEGANQVHGILLNMHEAAISIYDQYFTEKAGSKLEIDDVIVHRLLFCLKNDPPKASWFDEVKVAVIEKLEKDERFMPSFLKSDGYMQLLAELDLLKDLSKSDEEETRSLDEACIGETASLSSFDAYIDKENNGKAGIPLSHPDSEPSACGIISPAIKACISQKGVIKDGLSSHAVYAVFVSKSLGGKELNSWTVYRRYSDFYDLHRRMENQFKSVGGLDFPAKRTFNNMDKLFLDRRQYLLNEYLSKLLEPGFLANHPGLLSCVLQFFDHGTYEQSKSVVSRKVDSLVNPFVSSVRTVSKVVRRTPVPLVKGSSNPNDNTNLFARKYEGVTPEEHDNVPLRILLFLMDEIFDLQSRNQWLRKRIYYMLREILKAMYGDVFNQRIVDSVSALTSPESVAEFVRIIKNSLWPNGSPAMPRTMRDEATKMRTRVAAKTALLSCIPDEIRHLIGSETTRQGGLRVFELFQNPVLNRRLIYVCLEDIFDTLFPEQNVSEFFEKFHS